MRHIFIPIFVLCTLFGFSYAQEEMQETLVAPNEQERPLTDETTSSDDYEVSQSQDEPQESNASDNTASDEVQAEAQEAEVQEETTQSDDDIPTQDMQEAQEEQDIQNDAQEASQAQEEKTDMSASEEIADKGESPSQEELEVQFAEEAELREVGAGETDQ